jgi:hypothetical protein
MSTDDAIDELNRRVAAKRAWQSEQLQNAIAAGVDRDVALQHIKAGTPIPWPTNAGHHVACDDPEFLGVDPRDCPGCEEAAEGEEAYEALRDAARRRREMLAHPSPMVQSEAPQGCSCNVNEPSTLCDYCIAVVESRRLSEATPMTDDQPWEYGPCDGCGVEVETVCEMWAHIDNPGRFCWRAANAAVGHVLRDHRGSRVNHSFAAHRIMDVVKLAYEEGKLQAAIDLKKESDD